jgi:hypothetical protein
MNKKEFIEIEINKNIEKFGRWASTTKNNSADKLLLIMSDSPKNKTEALQHRNALANTGNYPVGTSECFNVGLSGGCGLECYIFREGRCKSVSEEGIESALIIDAKDFIQDDENSSKDIVEMKEETTDG